MLCPIGSSHFNKDLNQLEVVQIREARMGQSGGFCCLKKKNKSTTTKKSFAVGGQVEQIYDVFKL